MQYLERSVESKMFTKLLKSLELFGWENEDVCPFISISAPTTKTVHIDNILLRFSSYISVGVNSLRQSRWQVSLSINTQNVTAFYLIYFTIRVKNGKKHDFFFWGGGKGNGARVSHSSAKVDKNQTEPLQDVPRQYSVFVVCLLQSWEL